MALRRLTVLLMLLGLLSGISVIHAQDFTQSVKRLFSRTSAEEKGLSHSKNLHTKHV